MRRRYRWMLSACALLAAFALAVQGFSQQKKPGEKPAPAEKKAQQAGKPGEQAPPGAPDMQEMMKKWQELNALGPQHEEMAKAVGKYDTVSRMWMAPGAPPVESKGTAEFELILDGRYLRQKYHCPGIDMGMGKPEPFEGIGLEGYDNFRKQYVSTWVDSMSTGILYMTGTCDETGNAITYTGKADDPMTGQKDKPFRMVVRKISDDKAVFEAYQRTPEGQEFKTMEIEYTRQK
jgi:hypothetical protein